jgi:hypothetical protein
MVDTPAAAQVKAHAGLGRCDVDQLDARLASHGGPWLLGERYCADPTCLLSRWTHGFARPRARCTSGRSCNACWRATPCSACSSRSNAAPLV